MSAECLRLRINCIVNCN